MSMHKCFLISLFLFVIASISGNMKLRADNNFEGIIIYELKGDAIDNISQKETLTFMVKNNKARIEVQEEGSDVSESGAVILIDMANDTYTTMIEKDGEKMAMSFDLSEFKSMIDNIRQGEDTASGMDVKVTDETIKINGYNCQKVIMRNTKMENEAWITKEISPDLSKLFPVFKTTEGWKQYTHAYEGFVMKVKTKYKDEKDIKNYSYKANVKEKALEDKLFNIPSDYQQVDMGQMMEQFKKANPKVYEKMLQQLQH